MKKNIKIVTTTILFTLFLALFVAVPQTSAALAQKSATIPIYDKNGYLLAIMEAHVNKLTGSQNELLIKINYAAGGGEPELYTFIIHNNAAGEYQVGSYLVYIATAGNDQISDFYIIKQQEIVQPHTHIEVTEFTFDYDAFTYTYDGSVKIGFFEASFTFKLSNGDSVVMKQIIDGIFVLPGRNGAIFESGGSATYYYPSDGTGCHEIIINVVVTTNRLLGDAMEISGATATMTIIPDFICDYE